MQKVTDFGRVSLGAPSFGAVLPRVAASRAGGGKVFLLKVLSREGKDTVRGALAIE